MGKVKKQNQPHASNLCGANTRKGEPCKNHAMDNGRCRMHGGASTGPKDQTKNKNAERHGFFSKYLPEESVSIIQEIQEQNPIDLLWDSILVQWAAIIRAQKLMYVKDQKSHTKSQISYTDSGDGYVIQHAWDKQEQFLNAQSRAINTLGQQIERYDKLCRSPLATEEQRQRIEKLKTEVEFLKGEGEDYNDDGFLDAIEGKVADIWQDEE